MKPLLAAVFLVLSGFAVTDAQAMPKLTEDEITGVQADNMLILRDAGPARLAGIYILNGQDHVVPQKVGVKQTGRDRYGDALVILYPAGSKESLQERMLSDGAALAYDRAATPKPWLAAERWARTRHKGVWSRADSILTPEQANAHQGEFRLVEGVVTRTYKSRDTYYVNFGDDWKTDFSLRIPRKAWRSFGKNLDVAVGSTVRARGAIFLENGPMIEITRPEQLERLHADAQ